VKTNTNNQTILIAFTANAVISVTKFLVAGMTGSTAMLAEAIHSLADTGNQALLLVGIRRGKKRATVQHPLGFGREQFFWPFVVAISLFGVGGLFSVYRGITQLVAGAHEVSHPEFGLLVLGTAFLFEGFSLYIASRHFQAQRGKASIFRFMQETKNPALLTVLLEDSAALVGLTIAASGLVLSLLTHNGIYDSLASVLIGLVLVVVASFLAREVKALLIGESASAEVRQVIRTICRRGQGVTDVLEIITLQIGPNDVLVTANLEFQGNLTTRQVVNRIRSLEEEIRAAVPQAHKIFIEPQIRKR